MERLVNFFEVRVSFITTEGIVCCARLIKEILLKSKLQQLARQGFEPITL
jgi:hypothetical protein